jgi:predicted RNA-binding Zn ribbon-like protein
VPKTVDTVKLVGGTLSLDFTNTIAWASDGRERPAHTDLLTEPRDLVTWGRRLGLVPPYAAPAVTARELSAARVLRRAVRAVFGAIANGSIPSPDALDRVARDYGKAAETGQLVEEGGLWRLDWPLGDPRCVRFAAAVDAIDLLRDDERLGRVRICPGPDCGWLFLDFSGRRRWCSMDVCGSRVKMRRLYERQRAR